MGHGCDFIVSERGDAMFSSRSLRMPMRIL
jgi:hypothetical protein